MSEDTFIQQQITALPIPDMEASRSYLQVMEKAKDHFLDSLRAGVHYTRYERRASGKQPGKVSHRLNSSGAQLACSYFNIVLSEPKILVAESDPSIVIPLGEDDRGNPIFMRGFSRYVVQVFAMSTVTERVLAYAIAAASSTEKKYRFDPLDAENTVCQMAVTRASIKAVVNACQLHDLFESETEEESGAAGAPKSGNAFMGVASYLTKIALANEDRKAFFEHCKQAGIQAHELVVQAQEAKLWTAKEFQEFVLRTIDRAAVNAE